MNNLTGLFSTTLQDKSHSSIGSSHLSAYREHGDMYIQKVLDFFITYNNKPTGSS